MVVTTIVRFWRDTRGWRDGTDAHRCRLCPACTVDDHGVCLVSVSLPIPVEDCAGFDRVKLEAASASGVSTARDPGHRQTTRPAPVGESLVHSRT